MTNRNDLIKTILRFDTSQNTSELEKMTDHELVILKVKAQYEYDRHNINLFRKGYTFHQSKNGHRTK